MTSGGDSYDTNTAVYDTVIVGAGIAGLSVALALARRGKRIAVADKYKFIGGRTFTYEADLSGVHYQWEEGAGRISERHELLGALLRKFGLGRIPIDSGPSQFRTGSAPPVENPFEASLPVLLGPLRSMPRSKLGATTLGKLLEEIHGPAAVRRMLDLHPYRAEFWTMRGDLALDLFLHEFSGEEPYFIVREGLSELVRRMRAAAETRGVEFLVHHELERMASTEEAVFRVGRPSEGTGRPESRIRARRFVFALPSVALARIPAFQTWPTLRHLRMEPLLRVYAVFPPGPDGTYWCKDLVKTVTPRHARFIIPGDLSKGVVQISYTDSTDAAPLLALLDKDGEQALGRRILEDLRVLFSPTPIPDPLFVKAHPWKEGVTYWLPGDYDPVAESRRAARPFPREHPSWYVCGESISLRQCWIEGALESAAQLLRILQ